MIEKQLGEYERNGKIGREKDFSGTPARQLKIEFAIFQNYRLPPYITRREDTPASTAAGVHHPPRTDFSTEPVPRGQWN